jgi:hypothetical protein
MAQLKKQVLGTISGAVGDVLFRVMNGNTYVGTKPSSFMPGMDTASINRRMRFSMATKFARSVNSVPELKAIWKNVTPSRLSQYNMMVKINYHNVQHNSVSNLIKLVPEIGFELNVSSIDITPVRLRVDIDSVASNAGINPATEQFFKLVGVFHLSNPVNEQNAPHVFMRIISEDTPIDLENPVNYQIPFLNQVSQLVDQYQDRKAFLTLLTLDINKNPVHYSNTFFNN